MISENVRTAPLRAADILIRRLATPSIPPLRLRLLTGYYLRVLSSMWYGISGDWRIILGDLTSLDVVGR